MKLWIDQMLSDDQFLPIAAVVWDCVSFESINSIFWGFEHRSYSLATWTPGKIMNTWIMLSCLTMFFLRAPRNLTVCFGESAIQVRLRINSFMSCN